MRLLQVCTFLTFQVQRRNDLLLVRSLRLLALTCFQHAGSKASGQHCRSCCCAPGGPGELHLWGRDAAETELVAPALSPPGFLKESVVQIFIYFLFV